MYDSVPGEEETQPISQAEEIRNLRNEIKELRTRINSQGAKLFIPFFLEHVEDAQTLTQSVL